MSRGRKGSQKNKPATQQQKPHKQQQLVPRTPWHLLLVLLLRERAPKHFGVESEVPLGKELPRADVVLLRREHEGSSDNQGEVLRSLWSMIAQDAVVEYKSVSRGFRRGELGKLQAYAGLYFWQEVERLERRANLVTVLLVPSMTPTLANELAALELVEESEEQGEESEEQGYRRYRGGIFPLVVVEVDEVAEEERDDLLGFLGHRTVIGETARQWLIRVMGYEMDRLKDLDEYEDFEARVVAALGDKVLASMTPEEVLARYKPEQRLAGLEPEQLAKGLSEEQKAALRKILDENN